MAKVSLRLYNREIEKLIDGSHIEEAIAHSKHILQTYPKHIDTYRLLGKAYLENQRYGESTDIFQRVLASAPDDFVAHIGLSIIREDEANLDAALWHMERAYEVQPSNSAIQDELRRLYGRRDGMEPPRIRLTRGALVRMYARGDLYQQALAEIRALLAEEPQRPDIQVLQARMCFLSGKKVEAIEVCGELLNKYPYCFEANRILSEILPGTSRSEDAKIYRQRVISLDPYMAFTSIERPTPLDIPDNAVTVERLDWQQFEEGGYNQPKWADSLGINLDETGVNAQPAREWLGTPKKEIPATAATTPPAEPPAAHPAENAPANSAPAAQQADTANAADNQIPEWMRDSGWTESTGQANEQESAFASTGLDGLDLPADDTGADGLKPAAIPDWLQALAPDVPVEEQTTPIDKNFEQLFASTPAAAEELESAVEVHPVPAEPAPSWLVEEAPQPGAAEAPAADVENADIPDWLKGFKSEEKSPVEENLPTWFMEDKVEEPPTNPAQTVPEDEVPAWLSDLNQLGAGQEPVQQPVEAIEPAAEQPATAALEAGELPAWLNELSMPQEGEEEAIAVPSEDRRSTVSNWIQDAQAETPPPAPAEEPSPDGEAIEAGELPFWMKDLAPAQPEETPAPPAAAETPKTLTTAEAPAVPDETGFDALPDWLNSLGTPETAETQPEPELAAPASPSAEPAAAAPEAALPDWLNEETEPAQMPQDSSTYAPKPTGSLDNWLHKFDSETTADAPTQPVRVKPASAVELAQDQAPSTPAVVPEITAEPAQPQDEALPEWLKGLSTEQVDANATVETAQAPLPDWLNDLETGKTTEPETPEIPLEAEPAGELPDWLNQIMPDPTSSTTPTPIPPGEVLTPAATPPAGAPSADNEDAALAWLEGLAAKHGADEETLYVKPEERLSAPPAWVQDSAAAAAVNEVSADEAAVNEAPAVDLPSAVSPVSEPTESGQAVLQEPVSQAEDLPDWLKELKETPEQPTGTPDTAPVSQAQMNEDAALAWIEGQAAKHGADEETLFVKPEDRQETAPDWVLSASADTSESADAVAPTVSVAAEEAMPGTTAPEAEKALDETTSVVSTPAATFEPTAETPAISKAQADEDAALAWLEGLAVKHGADEETLFVKPEDRQETAPDWVLSASADTSASVDTAAAAETTQSEPVASEAAANEAVIPEEAPAAVEVTAPVETRQEPGGEPVSPESTGIIEPAVAVEDTQPIHRVKPTAPPDEIIYSPAIEPETPPEINYEPAAPAVEPNDAALPEWLRGFETEETDAPTQPVQVTPPAAPNEEIEIAPQPVEENTTWLAGLAKSEAEKAGGLPPEAVTFAQPGGETFTSRRPENLPVRPAAAQVPAADDWQATLTQAQVALDEGQIIPALEGYTHLINSGQLIDEAIHDLRDALYHYPVEVTIWQALGDAYMRSNRIQDALDAYTKAEELLR